MQSPPSGSTRQGLDCVRQPGQRVGQALPNLRRPVLYRRGGPMLRLYALLHLLKHGREFV
jgi:hypothetical protein